MRKPCDPPGISGEFHSLATCVGHKTGSCYYSRKSAEVWLGNLLSYVLTSFMEFISFYLIFY